MSTKDFHIGDILSITTGRFVSLNHIGGVYDILNFMTNDDLSTVQLPRAAAECRSYLAEMYPELSSEEIKSELVGLIEMSENMETDELSTEEKVKFWLAPFIQKYGEFLPVRQIHHKDHENLTVQEDLEKMGYKVEIIDFENPNEPDEPNEYGDIS